MNFRRSWDRLKRFITILVRNILDDRIFFRGTSLAFTTTITLVPVTMVVFSFGGFDNLGLRILEGLGSFLLPDSSEVVYSVFESFTNNARRLGTLGSAAFLVSAVFMLNAVESHLNDIFRVTPHRRPAGRVGTYVASMLLVAFIFGSGFGPISGMMDAWHKFPPLWQQGLGMILSFLGAMAGMMVMFNLMSAARVSLRASMLGASVGALIFQAAKLIFTFWMRRSVRQSIIYGSLVFIPKLLLWLAVAWIIFLVAAEITYADQVRAGRKRLFKDGSPAGETALGWKVFLAINDALREGNKPPSVRDLAHKLAAPESRVADLIQRMETGGLVLPVQSHPTGFVPSKTPSDMKASEVVSVISGWDAMEDALGNEEFLDVVSSGITEAFGGRSVRSFLVDEGKDDIRSKKT